MKTILFRYIIAGLVFGTYWLIGTFLYVRTEINIPTSKYDPYLHLLILYLTFFILSFSVKCKKKVATCIARVVIPALGLIIWLLIFIPLVISFHLSIGGTK
jgi:hypothetical protein